MKKRRRRRNFRKAVIDWFSDVFAIMRENTKVVIAIAIFLVLVIVAIVVSTVIAKKKSQAEEVVVEDPTTVVEDEYVITEAPLEQDAYPEINTLMKKYYDACATGDVEAIEAIKTPVDDKEKIIIKEKSELIESYPVVDVYTKNGPEPDTYIVFAYYEVKLDGHDNMPPGLNAWYVCKNDAGQYYINDEEQDEKLTNYCKLIAVQDDVVDLNNTVNVKFNELMENDTELAAFLETLPDSLTAAVGEELARADAPEEPEAEETTVDADATGQNVIKKAKATDVVNIRSSDSETADKVGKAQIGDTFTVLEEKVNGWSKIEFEGKERYIKSEFLEVISEESASNNTASNETTDEAAAAASPDSGTARAKDTINVRKSASTSAEKIALCYKGDTVTVIQKQADGWSKIKYDGKTGYVKSEFLE